MGDSQQPKPAVPSFEVPDLELEPVPRSFRAPAVSAAPMPAPAQRSAASASSTSNVFDDDDFMGNSAGLELALGGPSAEDPAPHSARGKSAIATAEASNWPTGQAPERARLMIDPAELALLARYGAPPTNPLLTPSYAFAVFKRQRELKADLVLLDRELSKAELERENSLAELARAVRPEAERVEQLKRLLGPLLELEQVSAARGQALTAASAELTQQADALDGQLDSLTRELELAVAAERDAQRSCDAEQEIFRRADAKLKRVLIEIRAVTQVAEQKLGPGGGQVPEPEASKLAELRARLAATEPEVDAARASLATVKNALDQASARVEALRQHERLAGRKKQALVSHYQRELDLRNRSLHENVEQERAALANLARAVLALRGAVAVPEALIADLRSKSERAEALTLRAERHLRALDAYDRARVTQGVRLACTALVILAALIALKLFL